MLGECCGAPPGRLRDGAQHRDDSLERKQEFGAETDGTFPVPGIGLREVGLGLRREADGHSALVRRDRMEDQG